MRLEVLKWKTGADGIPEITISIRGKGFLMRHFTLNRQNFGFLMDKQGTLGIWYNNYRNVIKKYPVDPKKPYIANSAYRLLELLASTLKIRIILQFEADNVGNSIMSGIVSNKIIEIEIKEDYYPLSMMRDGLGKLLSRWEERKDVQTG